MLDKITKLKNHAYYHPNFETAIDEISMELNSPVKKKPILLIGPTRVGKTHFMQTIQSLNKQNDEKKNIIYHALHAPADRAHFRWKEDFYSLLELLNERQIEKKVRVEKKLQKLLNESSGAERGRYLELRSCMEKISVGKNVNAFFLDEGNYLVRESTRAQVRCWNMDVLRDFSDRTEILLLIACTYEGHSLLFNNDEAASRAKIIHFKRYDKSTKSLTIYRSLIEQIQEGLDLDIDSAVMDPEVLWTASLGLIGLMTETLLASLVRANYRGEKKLTYEAFKESILPASQLQEVEHSIQSFESMIDLDDNSIDSIKLLTDKNDSKRAKNKSNRKVGQRNPARDQVGFT